MTTVDDSAYLLLDEIGERICAVWGRTCVKVSNPLDLASRTDYASRFALCTYHEAGMRVNTLLNVGILRVDGSVDDNVMAMLRRKGARRLGLEDAVPKPEERQPDDEPDKDDDV